jgi:phosphate uptake regulator
VKYRKSIGIHVKNLPDTVQSYEDRYIRRVQLTGRGSYIVSIPKQWVEEAGLKKGGRIEFSRQQNQGLLLIPFERSKYDEDSSRCSISIPPDFAPDTVTRIIISLYVTGYSTIEVNSKSGNLNASVRDSIRDVARKKLVGTEVVTESSKSTTLQVLLSYPQLLVPDALRRMSSIASSMQQDAMQALAGADHDLARQVIKTDDEIDRFGLYIIRQLKWAVRHPPLLERIGLTVPVECLGYRIVTKSVERSADHAARVAQNCLLLQQPLNPALLRDSNALSQLSQKMMENALRALFSGDYQLAESILVEKEKASAMETKLVERLLKEKLPPADLSALRLISESLRRIGEYATDVAEVVLNLTVQKFIEPPLKTGPIHG